MKKTRTIKDIKRSIVISIIGISISVLTLILIFCFDKNVDKGAVTTTFANLTILLCNLEYYRKAVKDPNITKM